MSISAQDANYHRVIMANVARQTNDNQISKKDTNNTSIDNDGHPDRQGNNNLGGENADHHHHHHFHDFDNGGNNTTTRPVNSKSSSNHHHHHQTQPTEQTSMPTKKETIKTVSIQGSVEQGPSSSASQDLLQQQQNVSKMDSNLQHTASSITPQNINKMNQFLYDKSNFNHFKHSPFDDQHLQQSETIHCEEQQQQRQRIDGAIEISNDASSSLSPNNNNKDISLTNQMTTIIQKSSSSSLSSAASTGSSSSASSVSTVDYLNTSSSMDEEYNLSNSSEKQVDGTSKLLNRRQWFHLWLPSYKSRLNQFQKQFTDKISSREKLIDDFVCAIHREVLLQGRMYVSMNYISFYSNIFGYETVVNISYHDIKSISRASTVRLFPNAIQIITNSGLKYFFTSFVSRERAFRLMTKLWQMACQEKPMPWTEIRKLIRESYTTSGLGVDLSDIDDADVEIDLTSKKIKKKKHLKSQIKNGNSKNYTFSSFNSSSEMNSNPEDGEEESTVMRQNIHSIDINNSNTSSRFNNADVQTDDLLDHLNYEHQCSLVDVFKQLFCNMRNKLWKKSPNQSQMVKFLFILALILFAIQIGIYLRFTTLNQLLLNTQKLLAEAIKNQQINNNNNQQSSFVASNFSDILQSMAAGSRNSNGGKNLVTDNYCYLNSGQKC